MVLQIKTERMELEGFKVPSIPLAKNADPPSDVSKTESSISSENNEPEVFISSSQDNDIKNSSTADTNPSKSVSAEPKRVSADPKLVSAEPKSVSAEPKSVSADPKLVSADPKLVSPEPKRVSPEPKLVSAEPKSVSAEPKLVSPEPKLVSAEPKSVVTTQPDPPLPYNEPLWSATPPRHFFLTVIKHGSVIEEISLSRQPFHVFGRLPSCDVQLEHPSISRYHAVLQYRPSSNSEGSSSDSALPGHMTVPSVSTNPKEEGFYVYDLGSTHGTYINKTKVQTRCYYRLRFGQMVKFGGSSRLFLLECSSEDQVEIEAAAEEEIKEIVDHRDSLKRRRAELEARQRLAEKEQEDMVTDDIPSELGEDGQDYEIDAEKEAFYKDDPKKALKKYFDREGLELEYETEEEGPPRARVFTVRVRLPIDTSSGEAVCAEASLKGKKKDAVIQCALDACRMLDAQGMLRHHTRAHKTKDRNWEEHDYYDSDEDTFLDRTGTVEMKRTNRMKKAGVLQDSTEKYETLEAKLRGVEIEMASIEKRLASDSETDISESTDKDALEFYMSNISGHMDRSKRLELKHQLYSLKKENERLLKLMKMVRKTNLPELKSSSAMDCSHRRSDSRSISSDAPSDGEKAPNSSNVDDEDNKTLNPKKHASLPQETISQDKRPSRGASKRKKRRLIGPAAFPPLESSSSVESGSNNRDDKGQKIEDSMDYSDWLPPERQTGDGKTYLNEKFGY